MINMSTPRTLATDIVSALADLKQPIDLLDIQTQDTAWKIIKGVIERAARADGPVITLTNT